ncbi:hypothetical protein [Gallionella capsiferriformans]|jgi:hypothetical protein|uniref:DUF2946 domain-containing protein n=1 Tax=Gallionella capsiferriformans (strain ES-2) TaxID=395494 RepID=D9SI02_GALCS|nr:hypothetical protein [Gallionella capsiferriformans]ADL56092.1 hypothetical protein Galf_2087 [Gallionella capsiferriformans ES-2]
MSHSLFARFLLIFALLFAQTGGLTHGISHAMADQAQDQSLPHNCDLCAAYAQLGHGIGSSAVHLELTVNHDTPHCAIAAPAISSLFVAFSARAPPYSA